MPVLLLFLLIPVAAFAGRTTVSLDGVWRVADSVSATDIPKSFDHQAPVPGLVHLASPPFADVDAFDSREVIDNRIRKKELPESARVTTNGVARQARNWFWYTRTFRAPRAAQEAILRIAKAQFTTAVWLNGRPAGEHAGCFTAGYFPLTHAMNWDGENTLLVRVGAHPGVVPPPVPAGTDFEKLKWTPGIYDSVTLILADNPLIETVQVAPRLQPPEILIQTVVRNTSAKPVTAQLTHVVHAWKQDREVGRSAPRTVEIGAGITQTISITIPLPNAHWWSPEDPFLYVVETSTGGDAVSTRFGMREFRFDTPTRRAYLNGKLRFLRGSNITLHRFFEDPQAGALPWNEEWVRKLLVDIPKRMHWDTFRFCIGPAPERWFDIADEAGLMIQNEYFIWTGRHLWHADWTRDSLKREYSEYMRDHWNHPSMVLWDAANETFNRVLPEEVIPSVRGLDLSNRPWDAGYNVPSGPDDPIEDHPYLFSNPKFRPVELERMTGARSNNTGHPSGHAAFINEYGWLWLNRDGTPTRLTKDFYDGWLGPNAKPAERFELNAYLLAGLTEFWRAHRNFAGVLHFVYLTATLPGAYTADHFRDVEKLELEPNFAGWVSEAFKPLGVYLNFWQPSLAAGAEREYAIMLVNDEDQPVRGRLILGFDGTAESREVRFDLAAFGAHTLTVPLRAPAQKGKYVLKAAAWADRSATPTLSRRHVTVE